MNFTTTKATNQLNGKIFCNEKYEYLFLQFAIIHNLYIAENFHYAYAITWHYALRSIIVIPVQ